jgi:hypothetical protein
MLISGLNCNWQFRSGNQMYGNNIKFRMHLSKKMQKAPIIKERITPTFTGLFKSLLINI